MTKQYDNTNRFTLNKNADKKDAKDRDYKGTVNIDGREYWLSGYITNSRNGPFISGTVKPKDAPEPRKADPISSGPIGYSNVRKSDMDDEIPFAPEFR